VTRRTGPDADLRASLRSGGRLKATRGQDPPDDRRRFTFDELIWGSGCIVDEEHTATRFQAVRHERPEGFKQAERYV
jgi:hypothetical protein